MVCTALSHDAPYRSVLRSTSLALKILNTSKFARTLNLPARKVRVNRRSTCALRRNYDGEVNPISGAERYSRVALVSIRLGR